MAAFNFFIRSLRAATAAEPAPCTSSTIAAARKRLERLCRYLLRPPDGQVRVLFEKPNRFGATYAQKTPTPSSPGSVPSSLRPGAYTVRCYGVFGQLELPAITTLLEAQLRAAAPSRLSWMKLLARVFRIDISVCARCCGPMRVTRVVTTPEDIAAELRGARPPPLASPPGQLLLFSASPPAP